jgi:hypothetical protein
LEPFVPLTQTELESIKQALAYSTDAFNTLSTIPHGKPDASSLQARQLIGHAINALLRVDGVREDSARQPAGCLFS